MNGKDIFNAVEYVGHDLVDLADKQTFSRSLLRQLLPVAAMAALLLGLGAFLLPKFPKAPQQPEAASQPVAEAPSEPVSPPPAEIQPEQSNPLLELFPQLDAASLTNYVQAYPGSLAHGWERFYINEAGLDRGGTILRTTQGDQVLAIDAENQILLLRVRGEDYQGVLAIAADPTQLRLQPSSQLGVCGETVGTIAQAHGGVLAMTGGYFIDAEGGGNGGTPAGFLMCDGVVCGADAPGDSGFPSRLEIDGEGRFTIADAGSPVGEAVRDALDCSLALIVDGAVREDFDGWSGIHPRACIGQTRSGAVLMLVVEGRMPARSYGTNAAECAGILSRYGAVNAINLDGGTSSILWFRGEPVTMCSNLALPEGRPLPNAFVVAGTD